MLIPPILTLLALLAAGVAEGAVAATAVPLRALATFWNAAKLRPDDSSELIALYQPRQVGISAEHGWHLQDHSCTTMAGRSLLTALWKRGDSDSSTKGNYYLTHICPDGGSVGDSVIPGREFSRAIHNRHAIRSER